MPKRTAEDVWAAALAKLTPAAQATAATWNERDHPLATAPPPDDGDEDRQAFDRVVAKYPIVAERLAAMTPAAAPSPAPDLTQVRYGVVESPDGEWPVTRLFKTPEGLATHLGRLEGSDTSVACFYGVPLPITKGPQRYLLLPDGANVVEIPLHTTADPRVVSADAIRTAAIEENGFLGPPELATTRETEVAAD